VPAAAFNNRVSGQEKDIPEWHKEYSAGLLELLVFLPMFHITICGVYQLLQGGIINLLAGPELDMAHELSSALKQAIGVGKLGATKEPDIDVSFEGIGVGERCVPYTCGGMTVMQ
jgi:hypothetical protein